MGIGPPSTKILPTLRLPFDRIGTSTKERDHEPIRWLPTADNGREPRHAGDRDDPVERSNEIALHHARCEAEITVRSLKGIAEVGSWQIRCLEERLELQSMPARESILGA
jgi:hypothetical protein